MPNQSRGSESVNSPEMHYLPLIGSRASLVLLVSNCNGPRPNGSPDGELLGFMFLEGHRPYL